MDLENTNEKKKTYSGINPLLEKFLAVTLAIVFLSGWVLIIAVTFSYVEYLFSL